MLCVCVCVECLCLEVSSHPEISGSISTLIRIKCSPKMNEQTNTPGFTYNRSLQRVDSVPGACEEPYPKGGKNPTISTSVIYILGRRFYQTEYNLSDAHATGFQQHMTSCKRTTNTHWLTVCSYAQPYKCATWEICPQKDLWLNKGLYWGIKRGGAFSNTLLLVGWGGGKSRNYKYIKFTHWIRNSAQKL